MLPAQQAQQIVNQALALYDSKVKAAQANPVNEIQRIKIDLSVARSRDNALKISFPFKTVRIEEASDATTQISLLPESDLAGRGHTNLRLRDSLKTEFGFSSCYLFWEAQASKELIIAFYTTSNIDNGSLLLAPSTNDGTLKIGSAEAPNDGLSFIMGCDINNVTTVGVPFSQSGNWNAYTDKTYNFGTATNMAQNGFVVPVGYELELLGSNYNIYTALASSFYTMELAAIKNGETEPSPSNYITQIGYSRSVCGALFGGTAVVNNGLLDMVKGISAGFYDTTKNRKIWRAGEMPYVFVTKNAGATTAIGFGFTGLFRLKRVIA